MLIFSIRQLQYFFEAIADKLSMNAEEKAAWVGHCVEAELRGNIMQGLANLELHFIQRFLDGRVIFGAEMNYPAHAKSMGGVSDASTPPVASCCRTK